tara:strand:+ start:105 stop:1517 length:1413 start_codon:yes stop_codon:yes gene_type:complete
MSFTRTKIICTIGPASSNINTLKKLHKSGMNVARINMSHATHESAKGIIDSINEINSSNAGSISKIGILLDTQGPEIRTGDTSLPIELEVGDNVTLTVRDETDVETSSIKVNYKGLIESVSVGSQITVDNGLINFKVLSKKSETLVCKVIHGGKIGSKRHVNLPGVRINMPSITPKDIEDIEFGIKHNVDFIAASFVRSRKDLNLLEDILKKKNSQAKIIAKIENQEGLDNIEDICKSAWGIMVARGDLGIETSLTDLPNIQRKIMFYCAVHGKRSIVATHLLESMINNPTPTRAEVTDIANAIYEGADALMLSGETSVGKYPIECVSFLKSLSIKTEKFKTLGYESNLITNSDWESIAMTAKNLSESINADGIIAITRTGATANYISNAKPNGLPIFTFTNNLTTLNQLSLVGSTHSFYIPRLNNHDKNLMHAKKELKKYFKNRKNLKFVMVSGIFSEEHSDAIQIINF